MAAALTIEAGGRDEPKHLSPELVQVIDQALCEAVERLEAGRTKKEAVSVAFALAEDEDEGAVRIALTLKDTSTRTAEVFARGGQLRLPG